jgi:hypothetical protein
MTDGMSVVFPYSSEYGDRNCDAPRSYETRYIVYGYLPACSRPYSQTPYGTPLLPSIPISRDSILNVFKLDLTSLTIDSYK